MPLILYVSYDSYMFEAGVPVGNTIVQGTVENMIDRILGTIDGTFLSTNPLPQ
jgi:hypothetical protein